MRTKTNQKGFTLIELLIVVAIIGIIAAIAVPGLLRARMSGNEASAIGSMRAINTAQQNYSQQCNGYAPNLGELGAAGAGNYLSPDLTGTGATTASVTKSGFTIALTGTNTLATQAAGCTGSGTNYYGSAAPLSSSTGSRAFATNEQGTIYFATGTTPPTSAVVTAGTATPIQ